MINFRTALFTLTGSLLAAHHASANCITDSSTAKAQIDALASMITPSPGTDLQANPTAVSDGWETHFSNGGAFYLDACNLDTEGPHPTFRIGGLLQGAIGSKYAAMSGPSSVLAWPVSNMVETVSGDGHVNFFEGQFTDGTPDGAIYLPAFGPAESMHGIIFQQYEVYGQTASVLGYPTSDERACIAAGCASGDRENAMQHGFMEFSFATDVAWGVLTNASASSHLTVSNNAFGGQAHLTLSGSGYTPNSHVQVFFNTPHAHTLMTTSTIPTDAHGNLAPASTFNLSESDGFEDIGTIEVIGAGLDTLAGVVMD